MLQYVTVTSVKAAPVPWQKKMSNARKQYRKIPFSWVFSCDWWNRNFSRIVTISVCVRHHCFISTTGMVASWLLWSAFTIMMLFCAWTYIWILSQCSRRRKEVIRLHSAKKKKSNKPFYLFIYWNNNNNPRTNLSTSTSTVQVRGCFSRWQLDF